MPTSIGKAMNGFEVGQIVRNKIRPACSYTYYKIKGFELEMLEVRECDRNGVELPYETEFWSPKQVELHEVAEL